MVRSNTRIRPGITSGGGRRRSRSKKWLETEQEEDQKVW